MTNETTSATANGAKAQVASHRCGRLEPLAGEQRAQYERQQPEPGDARDVEQRPRATSGDGTMKPAAPPAVGARANYPGRPENDDDARQR